MRRQSFTSILAGAFALALAALVHADQAAAPAKKAQSAAPAAHHTVLAPADLKWGPAPPVLPAGAQVAVLDGDPFTPGFYALRLKMPDGYKIMPHSHPTDESVVVIQGAFSIGAGDAYGVAMQTLPAGGFVKLPAGMHHFAGAKGETIVQVYGQGPFVVNYVNPADDPSKKK